MNEKTQETTIWDYLYMIGFSKKIPEFDAHFEKVYSPFMAGRFFSLFHENSAILANTVNKNSGLPKKNHFLFLHSVIRKAKRSSKGKWPKGVKEDRIKFIMEVYNYSYHKAKACSDLITDENYKMLEELQFKGEMIKRKNK